MGETSQDPVPSVSVIVCHHRGELWRECFESLQKSIGITFELIVVSSNPPACWVGEWFTVIDEQGGPAHKRNVGVSHAKGKYLVFLDDDTEVSPYTLYNFWRGFQELPTAGMLFSRIYNMERRSELDDCASLITPTGFLWARASDKHITHDELMQPMRCFSSKSAGCAIRRNTFYDAGGFDAGYFILGEESELAHRVWLRGSEVWYYPHAVLWHAFNSSLKPAADYYSLRRIHFLGARNYVNMLLTGVGTAWLIRMLPVHLLGWMIAAILFTLQGHPERGILILEGLWWNVVHLPDTLKKRRQVQSTRRRSDKTLFHMVMYAPPPRYYWNRMRQYLKAMVHG